MKILCILALFAIAIASTFPLEKGRIHGENGWYVPQLNSSYVWMHRHEAEIMLAKLEKEEIGNNFKYSRVTFVLYTELNPDKIQIITANTKSIDKSTFNPHIPTRLIIHGWRDNYYYGMSKEVRDAWLKKGTYNIIMVDWTRARWVDYPTSVAAVPNVGRRVAAMIDFLVKKYNTSLDTLKIIGNCLGAHIAGFAGKYVESGKIHCIIGLDPSLPLFDYKKPEKRLASTDAWYVESIQTDGDQLGFLKPIGKGAFYPTGGKSQPGCDWDLTGKCNHERSLVYYAEAVLKDNYPTVKCSDFETVVEKDCGSTFSSVKMGALSITSPVSGNFYVPLKSKRPFGMGS